MIENLRMIEDIELRDAEFFALKQGLSHWLASTPQVWL